MPGCNHDPNFHSHALCGEALRERCVVLTRASASISTPWATFIWAVKRRARSHEPLNGSCCFFIALSADLSRKRSSLPDRSGNASNCLPCYFRVMGISRDVWQYGVSDQTSIDA